MNPRRGENPPLSSNSRSQSWRAVRSHEGHSRELGFQLVDGFRLGDKIDKFSTVRRDQVTARSAQTLLASWNFYEIPTSVNCAVNPAGEEILPLTDVGKAASVCAISRSRPQSRIRS